MFKMFTYYRNSKLTFKKLLESLLRVCNSHKPTLKVLSNTGHLTQYSLKKLTDSENIEKYTLLFNIPKISCIYILYKCMKS